MEATTKGGGETFGQRFERAHVPAGGGAPIVTNRERESGPGGPPTPPKELGQGPGPPKAEAPPPGAVSPVAADRDEGPTRPYPGPGWWFGETFVAGALYVLACLAAVLGVAGGLYQLSLAAEKEVRLADWLAFVGWILGGLAGGCVLAAMAAMLSVLRRQRVQAQQLADQFTALSSRVDQLGRPAALAGLAALPAESQAIKRMGERLDRLEEALAEVGRNSLLDEAGRAQKRHELALQQRDRLVEQIKREMAEGQWVRARGAIERFRASYPSETEQADRLADEFDQRREQAEAQDIATARGQCDELLSVLAWDRAVAVANELLAKHPDSTAARALVVRVDREHRLAQEQQRQALYGQIQRHTSRREWKDALQAAGRLINQFPESIEAEAIKAQMETLAANAEIQQRQGLELTIKDLIKRQRFDEAIQLAEELIAAYPNSPQAGALREQLDRLKERSRQAADEAKKRRVKIAPR